MVVTLYQNEPKNIDEALLDHDLIVTIQEELNQFERNNILTLLPAPKDRAIIGIKWVF